MSKRLYVLIAYDDPAVIDERIMTGREAELLNSKLEEEAWITEKEYKKGRTK